MNLSVGMIVEGKYKILNEIGRGGMSTVWLAINERANKTWAIKECRKDGGNRLEITGQSLIAETEMLKRLSHPYLPSIVDIIDAGENFLIVMDYIEGTSLKDVLQSPTGGSAQSPDDVIEWAMQLCDVLGYLHNCSPPIIYRDMKPANVMLRPNGTVTLIDFGTAREYKGGRKSGDTVSLGTLGYAAPEQLGAGRGESDARTDIYCLGATIYHLLTGYSPASTNNQILKLSQLNSHFAGSGIEKIVEKCCNPDPDLRYQSCEELSYALSHVHDGDDAVIRANNRKWCSFFLSVCLTILSGISMLTFSVLGNQATKSTYDFYIARARSVEEQFSDAAYWYQQAISLRPSDATGYLELLSVIENDVAFSSEEHLALTSCIMASDGGTKKNIDYLESGAKEAYDGFVYRLANDYYFFYEGSDNRMKAASWYEKILDSPYLDEQKVTLANSLYTIGNYYASLGEEKNLYIVDETAADYRTFWDALALLCDGDVTAKTGGARYAVALYKEFVVQIYDNAPRFKSSGVTLDEVTEQLEKIAEGLQSLTSENQMIATQIEETTALLEAAGKMARTAYHSIGEN